MSIKRSAERRTWTTIDNRTIEDPMLSFGALGMLAYILSKPDNWTIRTADMLKRGGIKRPTYVKWLSELESAGYASLERVQGERGRFSGTTWVVTESPSDRDSLTPNLGQSAPIVMTDVVVKTETAVKTETTGAPPAEHVTADIAQTAAPKRVRAPSPWSAFRTTVLDSYGQASNKGTQSLATRIIQTAEHHGLEPEDAARAWQRWRTATTADDTARYWPIHRAAEGWGAWLQERRASARPMPIRAAAMGRVESREVTA